MVMALLRQSYYSDAAQNKVFLDPLWLGEVLRKGTTDFELGDAFIDGVHHSIQGAHSGMDWVSDSLEIFMCASLNGNHWVVVVGRAQEKMWRCVWSCELAG